MTVTLASDRTSRMGRTQVNDPEETTSARFATGTMARIRAVLQGKESMNAFIKAAVLSEITRRERAAKRKPDET